MFVWPKGRARRLREAANRLSVRAFARLGPGSAGARDRCVAPLARYLDTARMKKTVSILPSVASLILLGGSVVAHSQSRAVPRAVVAQSPPRPSRRAKAFIDSTNQTLRRLTVKSATADWVKNTYITDDTERLAAAANDELLGFMSEAVKKAATFENLPMDPDTRRMLLLLRVSSPLAAPRDPALRLELTTLAAKLEGLYGKAKSCPPPAAGNLQNGGGGSSGGSSGPKDQKCLDIEALNVLFQKSHSEPELREAWLGWHRAARESRPLFTRFVELANQGAREIGFADTGLMWRSAYDMTPAAFEQETERLWQQVRPLYEQLHCYVRAQLAKAYGRDRVPPAGAIPAHLLGNMWAQEWGNIQSLVEPYQGQPTLDVSVALAAQKWDAVRMVRTGEAFFTSVGLDPLPSTFWERSMLLKPRDREVVCHASAWDVMMNDDLRIKMCIKPTEEDLITIHHELGHDYYFHAYFTLPALYQAGANDGFHEALGDALTLSITPQYLKGLGLLPAIPKDEKGLINVQMKEALAKVAFLPFGLLIDKWRWDVFAGKIKPADYNKAWWQLRRQYQGLEPPEPRTDEDFDPGAKYHIPANVPYTRYFLARLLQFQFHRALCRASGHTGPLHQCSIYGSKVAGTLLSKMMAMGASKPWPDALEALGGERQIDASALLEYFASLGAWLKEKNAVEKCGW